MLLSSLALLALLTPAPELVIHSVEIRGTHPPVTLETREGEPFKPDTLTHDVHMLWATGRFSDVQVERSETPEGVDVVFRVTQAPQLRLRKFEFDPNGDRLPIKLESGAPVDEHAVAGLGAKLRQRLVEDGHPGAQVTTDLVPAGPGQADVHVKLDSGPREVVREVQFIGDPGIDEKDLMSAMRATHVRRILPKIWKRKQPYSDAAVRSDLARLRSLYISRGYLDAKVRLDDVEHSDDGKVTLSVYVNAGPRFGVRNSEMVSTDTNVQTALGLTGAFSGREVCACLLKARRTAEKEGRLDFDVKLRTDDVDAPVGMALQDNASLEKWVDLSARVSAGPQYRVGRIEFRGNHSFSDSTVRRVFKLDEGDLLNPDLLRRSVGRVNKLGLFETVNGDQVYVIRDPETGTADVRVALKELPRGRWYLSGPAGPMSVGGPIQAAISARLPGWGSGILEASTYFLSFSLSSWANPLAGALMGVQKTRMLFPLLAIERPFLEGQGWASGFVLSPQLGWQSMLMGYGMTQAQRRLKNLLIPDAVEPDLTAALQRYRPGQEPFEAGTLLCEAPKPRWRVARIIAGFAVDFALGARPF